MKILKIEFFEDRRLEGDGLTGVTAVFVQHDTTEEEAAQIKQVVDVAFPQRSTRVFEQQRGPKRLA